MADSILARYGVSTMARVSLHYFNTRDEIDRANLPELSVKAEPVAPASNEPLPTLDQAERDLIARALDRFRNDKEQAARALGLTVRTLYRRIKKFGLI